MINLTAKDFKSTFILKTETKLTKFLEQVVQVRGPSGKLRKEYQPTMITHLLRTVFTPETSNSKIHVGCGGGKSLIGFAAICTSLLFGKAKKVVVTAPTIALCNQLQREFCEQWACFSKVSHHTAPAAVAITNVSSYGVPRSSLRVEQLAVAEQEEAENVDMEPATDLDDGIATDVINLKTGLNYDKIRAALRSDMVTVFFVCLPSFFNTFSALVLEEATTVDITWHDEYHNLISQETHDTKRRTLKAYALHSRLNWFSSASRKYGRRVSHTDSVFGTEIYQYVKSSDLVKWGYLVRNLRVFCVTPADVKGISRSIKEYFYGLKIEKPDQFYKEAAVILKVMELQIEQLVPKAIVFGSFVPFLREMYRNTMFMQRLDTLVNGVLVRKLDSGMKRQDCDLVLNEMKEASVDIATLLLQHSKVCEGIDLTNLNTAIVCRGMSEITLQQALGRIQRVNYADPSKDTAYLFLYIDDQNSAMEQAANMAYALHYACGDIPFTVESLSNDRRGMKPNESDENRHLGNIAVGLKDVIVNIREVDCIADVINAKREQIAQEQRKADALGEIRVKAAPHLFTGSYDALDDILPG